MNSFVNFWLRMCSSSADTGVVFDLNILRISSARLRSWIGFSCSFEGLEKLFFLYSFFFLTLAWAFDSSCILAPSNFNLDCWRLFWPFSDLIYCFLADLDFISSLVDLPDLVSVSWFGFAGFLASGCFFVADLLFFIGSKQKIGMVSHLLIKIWKRKINDSMAVFCGSLLIRFNMLKARGNRRRQQLSWIVGF